MNRQRKPFFWIGLAVYGLLLFMFLSVSRLPMDKILGRLLTWVTDTQTRVSAETVSFSFPLSYALQRVTWEAHWSQGVSKDRADILILGPEWSKIFSGSLPLKTEASLARGRMEARLGVPFLRQGYADARVYDIHLEDLSFVEILLDRRLTGKGEGELRLAGDVRSPSSLNGRGFLRATDGSVETKLPLAGLRTFPFQSVSASLTIQKGVLFLRDGTIEGPAISGSFSGDVTLGKPLSRSPMNITARLTPMSMLNENEFVREWLISLGDEGQPITIHLEGPLESPSIHWEKD